MDIEKYLKTMRTIQNALLDVIDSENDKEIKHQSFLELLNQLHIKENPNEFRSFLHLLSKIAKNHHSTNLFMVVQNILTHFYDDINQNFLNSEIFTFFKSNKKILLFLIKSKMLIIDQYVVSILKKDQYSTFFFPEIQNFLEKDKIEEISKNISDDFEIKRQIGENDSYICQLIRNDSIDEFINYVNNANISLTSEIPSSIYETNSFIYKHDKTTLIEYAAFFGSIQIFKYLKMNIKTISGSIWSHAIYSNKPEIFHLLEESDISTSLKDKDLNKSIKCFHKDITDYILNKIKFNCPISKLLKYYNFEYIQEVYIKETMLVDFCAFDYTFFVELFLNSQNANQKIGYGRTLLYFATKNNNFEIVKLLLSIQDIDINFIQILI